MLEFIKELAEARIYKGTDILKGKSAVELAKLAYFMIMIIEILRWEDKSFAQQYVRATISYENFDAMRSNATDLHNLLAVLNNQDKFSGKIKTDAHISVPVLQLKRYLRDVESGKKDPGLDRAFLKSLEKFFKISDSAMREIRRDVADWNQGSASGKATTRNYIKNHVGMANLQTDLVLHFKNVAHRREI